MSESSPKTLWINTRIGKAFFAGIFFPCAWSVTTPINLTFIQRLANREPNESFALVAILYLIVDIVIFLGVIVLTNTFLKRYGFEGFKFSEKKANMSCSVLIAFFGGTFALGIVSWMLFSLVMTFSRF